MDNAFIDGLIQFRKLRYLFFKVSKIDGGLSKKKCRLLRKLNSLTQIHIAAVPVLSRNQRNQITSISMDNLVMNNFSSKELLLHGSVFTAPTFSDLSKLQNLQCLDLHLNMFIADREHIFNDIDWRSFKRLNQIERLTLYRGYAQSNNYLLRLLNSLGSRDTLQELNLYCNACDGLFESIRKFPYLKKIHLTIYNAISFKSDRKSQTNYRNNFKFSTATTSEKYFNEAKDY